MAPEVESLAVILSRKNLMIHNPMVTTHPTPYKMLNLKQCTLLSKTPPIIWLFPNIL